jgi:hypothetical protein
MARIPDLRLLIKEDFGKDDQEMIDKLAFPINNFMQQVITVLKNGIDFNNLNQQVITFTTSVNAQGVPVTPVQFRNGLASKVIGIICINALNQSSTTRFPEATPFISFTSNGTVLTITNISGLGIPEGQTNSDTYTFTILNIGQNL